jgi:hypothetical protein
MTPALYYLFIEPGPQRALGRLGSALRAVVPGSARSVSWGHNGLYIDGQTVELHSSDSSGSLLPLSFGLFTRTQRLAAQANHVLLQSEPALVAALADTGPLPLVCAVVDGSRVRLYHLVHHTVRGVLYVCFAQEQLSTTVESRSLYTWRQLLEQASPHWQEVQPLLSDNCAYSKWRADIEMERKFTFNGIPDTWRLIRRLHADVCAGGLSGFVPELDRDFQVFDYESHIYAVYGPDHERGYISFIPQADGRMTIKRKWFTRNAEIRRESLFPDQELMEADIERRVKELVLAPVRRLPSFRRKRFDVNFESLETGNVYGIYFDICRTVQRNDHAFSQCEVEYCRTRSFAPMRDVVEEFERVADYTEGFLTQAGEDFERNLYSKLDFALDAADLVREEIP